MEIQATHQHNDQLPLPLEWNIKNCSEPNYCTGFITTAFLPCHIIEALVFVIKGQVSLSLSYPYDEML